MMPHVERLTRLHDLLGTIPPEQFTLKHWTKECGTVCCAVGHAAQDYWFNKQGLTLAPDNSPAYDEYVNWHAVERFFDLSEADAFHLFSDGSYAPGVTPSDVQARIMEVING